MKRITTVLALVLALFIGGCGGAGSIDVTNDDYKFDNLQSQLDASNVKIDELISQINALAAAADNAVSQAQVNELQNQITILTNQLTALQAQVGIDNATITAEIKSLNDRITLLEGTVALLQAKVDGQAVQIADLIAQINVLNERIDELLARIEILEAKVCDCNENDDVYCGEGDPKDDKEGKEGDCYYDKREDSRGKHNIWKKKDGKWCFKGQSN